MSNTNPPVTDRMLAERIAAFNAQLRSQAPAEVIDTLTEEIAGLVRAGHGSQAPKSGDLAPAFTLPDARGEQRSLRQLLERGPVVLSFYRGQWCPYCDLQLRAYQEILPRVRALGATLVAISPQVPDESLSTVEKKNLEFHVLSDVGNRVARSYGLVFKLPEPIAAVQRGLGIDLEKSNGDSSGELPVPATFVVASDGRIAHAYVNADYRERLEPAELIRALEKLAKRR